MSYFDVNFCYSRVKKASENNFKYIEVAWPYDYTEDEFSKAVLDSGIKVVLINTPPGSQPGDMGLAAVPGRESDFIDGLKKAISYANAVQCKRIHIMGSVR